MNRGIYIVSMFALALFASAVSAQNTKRTAPTPSRGEMLYENHCTSCHDSIVHVRNNRRAKSLADVEYWVQRWSFDTGLAWKQSEIDDVTQYLVRRYYKFDKAK